MKYALVTGGSRGLGKAICLEIAEMGIPVIINYQSNETAANEVKSLIEAQGGQADRRNRLRQPSMVGRMPTPTTISPT